jgi:hypothetical protein
MVRQAEQIWCNSEDYLQFAGEHLNPDLLRADTLLCPEDEREWLRISFLFPTLPVKSKTELLVVRRFYLIAREHQARERENPQDSAEYSEAMADQVAGGVKGIFGSLSLLCSRKY